MTVACLAPDAAAGVALRFATFAACQGRALGENGFQALTGSAAITGLMSGLVTIFVALIGYRLILGLPLTLADGIGRLIRLGMVLTLTTSWPAFQTLVFNVVTNGPAELAAQLLPATGMPSVGLEERVQYAYDTMRLGVVEADSGDTATSATPATPTPGPAAQPAPQPRTSPASFGKLPTTASLFAVSTVGVTGALQIVIGFLLAIAPLAVLGLLFDSTLGLFSGWLRALGGSALAYLAATIVTALDLVMIEGELAAQQRYSQGMIAAVVDPQALTTLTLIFALVMLVGVLLAARTAGAILLRWKAPTLSTAREIAQPSLFAGAGIAAVNVGASGTSSIATRSRAAAVADDFRLAAARDETRLASMSASTDRHTPTRQTMIAESMNSPIARQASSLRTGGRRTIGRQSRRAARRDGFA